MLRRKVTEGLNIPCLWRTTIVCTKGERILTPVCALVQNDRLLVSAFFDRCLLL